MRTLKKCKDLGAGYCSYDIWLPYLVKLPGAPIDEYEPKAVKIDCCLLPEILELWKLGIKTVSNCCGHTIFPPTIGVNDEYIETMKKLGYKNLRREYNWEFIAKTKTCYGDPDAICKFADFSYEGNVTTEELLHKYLNKEKE